MNTNNDRIQLANNLLLEPVFAVDSETFLDLIVRNLQHNGRWLTWSKPDYSAENLKRYLAEQKAKWEAGEAREYVLIFNSAVVGSVGLYQMS